MSQINPPHGYYDDCGFHRMTALISKTGRNTRCIEWFHTDDAAAAASDAATKREQNN